MSREWSTRNEREILPYLNGEKKLIQTVEATRKHIALVYWIPPSGRNDLRMCDTCSESALFIYFDQDHTMRYYLRLFCDNCAYPDFAKWLSEGE